MNLDDDTPFTMADEFQSEPQDYARPATSYTVPCANLNLGDYVILKGRPCQIVDIFPSEADDQVQFIGIDLFTGETQQQVCLSSCDMDAPNVDYTDYIFLYTDDGFLNLLGADGCQKRDVQHPGGELGKRVEDFAASGREDAVVTVLSAMGQEAAVDIKAGQ